MVCTHQWIEDQTQHCREWYLGGLDILLQLL